MERCPIISKYCVMCFVGPLALSNTWAKLTPSIGDWVTPLMLAGGSIPSAPSTVGTMSMAWPYCVRTSPLALIPFGQWTMNGSLMPPR